MHELVLSFNALKEQVALAEIDLTKFVNGMKGGKAASVRVRKNTLLYLTNLFNIGSILNY